MIADPGPDPDDVKAILVAGVLHRLGAIRFAALVANGGGQALRRAQLARCVLVHVGVADVPVGIGSEGKAYEAQPHEYALEGVDQVPRAALDDGHALLLRTLRAAPPSSLTVCCISSLRDFADVIAAEPTLVLAKVVRLVVQGGLQRVDDASPWRPDSSVNNDFDAAAADAVYTFALARGLPLTVVSRFAVPMLPMQLARSFAERTANPLLRYLASAQFLGLEGLWRKLCEGKLPARCSKQWYFETFCGVSEAQFARGRFDELGPGDRIRQHLDGYVKPYGARARARAPDAQPRGAARTCAIAHARAAPPRACDAPRSYDVVALMTALPQTCALFGAGRPVGIVGVAPLRAGAAHQLLLTAEDAIDVSHVIRLLRDAYHETIAAARERELETLLQRTRAPGVARTARPPNDARPPLLQRAAMGGVRIAPARPNASVAPLGAAEASARPLASGADTATAAASSPSEHSLCSSLRDEPCAPRADDDASARATDARPETRGARKNGGLLEWQAFADGSRRRAPHSLAALTHVVSHHAPAAARRSDDEADEPPDAFYAQEARGFYSRERLRDAAAEPSVCARTRAPTAGTPTVGVLSEAAIARMLTRGVQQAMARQAATTRTLGIGGFGAAFALVALVLAARSDPVAPDRSVFALALSRMCHVAAGVATALALLALHPTCAKRAHVRAALLALALVHTGLAADRCVEARALARLAASTHARASLALAIATGALLGVSALLLLGTCALARRASNRAVSRPLWRWRWPSAASVGAFVVAAWRAFARAQLVQALTLLTQLALDATVTPTGGLRGAHAVLTPLSALDALVKLLLGALALTPHAHRRAQRALSRALPVNARAHAPLAALLGFGTSVVHAPVELVAEALRSFAPVELDDDAFAALDAKNFGPAPGAPADAERVGADAPPAVEAWRACAPAPLDEIATVATPALALDLCVAAAATTAHAAPAARAHSAAGRCIVTPWLRERACAVVVAVAPSSPIELRSEASSPQHTGAGAAVWHRSASVAPAPAVSPLRRLGGSFFGVDKGRHGEHDACGPFAPRQLRASPSGAPCGSWDAHRTHSRSASVEDLLRAPAKRLNAASPTHGAALSPVVPRAARYEPRLKRTFSAPLVPAAADCFVVHAEAGSPDEQGAIAAALREWARAFAQREGRLPTVWLDALSADPLLSPSEQLAHMPVYVARSARLLLLCGPSIVDSVRTVAQLYAWRASGGLMDRVECTLVAPRGTDDSARQARWRSTIAAFDTFHATDAQQLSSHADEARRIALAVEIGTIAHINETIRAFMTPVQRAAAADALGCAFLTPAAEETCRAWT